MQLLIIGAVILIGWLVWIWTDSSALLVWAWWLICFLVYRIIKNKKSKVTEGLE
jgi:hypothetical protein